MIKVEQLISWGSNSVTNARWTKKQNKKFQVLIVCDHCDHQTAGGELLKEDWMSEQMQDGKVLKTNWWVNSNNVILLFSYLNSFDHFQWIDKVPRGLQEQHGIQGACHPHWLLPQHPWGGLEEGGKEVIWLILLLSLLLIIDQTSNFKVANVTSSARPSGRQWSDCHHPNTLQKVHHVGIHFSPNQQTKSFAM